MISLVLAMAAAAMPPAPRLTEEDVRAIRATCQLPETWLRYRAGEVHMTPPKDASDEKLGCMLREAIKNFPKVGFVGNEL
ncbi:hypothetical protein HRJ34_25915 [Rhizorhabdus wittichii]|uniref:Uncharacterized protein n=1 Tax=Rhizorhabdus wittichii TaxID=160791 RepID=A0A975D2N3_9SPHN|nr:hypothetical protein [Rhizorhabdus wittichii]QTH21696.1 hypothetical protein HRJ34_25915 [Rhizorhabdus wittichii]